LIAVDSSVLIELLGGGGRTAAAAESLRDALHQGPVVLCDVVLAEVCTALQNGSDALQLLEDAAWSTWPSNPRPRFAPEKCNAATASAVGAESAPSPTSWSAPMPFCNAMA
jgi:predicted nucleic acid-binding protein